jgi:hypothetical protein
MRITANGVTGEVLHWTTTMQIVQVGDLSGRGETQSLPLAAVILDTGHGIQIVELGRQSYIFKEAP